MNWHLLKKEENKTLFQLPLYDSILEELRRIALKEGVSMRVLVRSAINDAIEEYRKIEATPR